MCPPGRESGQIAEGCSIAISAELIEQLGTCIARSLHACGSSSPPTPQGYLTVEEAAEYLDCCIDHVRTLYRRGDIRAFRPGRRILIDRNSLDEYIRSVPV